MKKFRCVNRDGALVGEVDAGNPNEAVLRCAEIWAEAGCYDIDHVHEVGDTQGICKHCEAIHAKHRAMVKH